MSLKDFPRSSPHDETHFDPAQPAEYALPQEQEFFPSDPDYEPVILLDARRAWSQAELERIQAAYETRFTGRTFVFDTLHPDHLRFWCPFQFPETERLFLARGYACMIENRAFRKGIPAQTSFEKQQRSALYLSAALLRVMLERAGRELGVVGPSGEGQRGGDTDLRDEQVSHQLGHLLGLQARGENPVALVEHKGLLLGCDTPTLEHWLHLAVAATPVSATHLGRQRETCERLFGCEFGPIRDQVRFELAGAAQIFSAQHWPQSGIGGEGAVTPGMIVTWYSQVLAALRKIAWEAEARSAPRVLKHALRREAEVHGMVIGANAVPREGQAASYEEHWNDEADRLAAHFRVHVTQITSDFTGEQWVTAALHGATLVDEPLYQVPEPFRFSAAWIGDLKRTGRGWLGVDVAEALVVVGWQAEGESRLFFRGLFSEAVWAVLLEAADEVIATGTRIEVTYAWTRDLDRPWGAQEAPGSLSLTGPLLSFPACRAAHWREKAALICDLGDFKAFA